VSGGRQRIDRWLWNARVVRTRTAAAALVVAGHVRVNSVRVTAPGRDVKCGDVVTIALDAGVRVLKATGMASRRGNASAASLLYEELSRAAVLGATDQQSPDASSDDAPPPRGNRKGGAENG
jgi:ribosome-associated heat shock protein Hsp15